MTSQNEKIKSPDSNIDWNFSSPRTGIKGALDKFVGPGATRAEIVLQFSGAGIAAVIALLGALRIAEGWSSIQYLVCTLLAIDIAGGIATNATSSAKRWYHRHGQGALKHFALVSSHLLHIIIVSWLYLAFDLTWILTAGGYLLFAAAVILAIPLYLQRPAALLCYAGGLILSLYFLDSPTGLEWFLPLLYLKLLVSHILKEEPYRPTRTT